MFSHESAKQTRHHNQESFVAMMPGEGAHLLRMVAMCF